MPESLDGMNTHWKVDFTPCISEAYFKEFLIIIYDRTGAKVFEKRGYDQHWDGWNGKLMSGKPANEGVYVYNIRYITSVGRLIERRGTLSLLRL